jgi:hypothetical protein
MNEGELENPYPAPWILDWRMDKLMVMVDKESRPVNGGRGWFIDQRTDVRRRTERIRGDA